jgi:hypothetical protein
LKLKVTWNEIPDIYKKAIEQKATRGKNGKILSDLVDFGVDKLSVFKDCWSILNFDSEKILPNLLTVEEMKLWTEINNSKGKIIKKERVIEVLRSESIDTVSFWAIDQAISRFRKKLDRAGIDSEQLRTIKGKGYIYG